MTPPTNVQRWYPHFEDHATHEAFRQAFDHIYALQDKMQQQQAAAGPPQGASTGDSAGGPSTTKIAGLRVHAVPPTNGQKLTFNAATGEIEWQ